MELDVPMDMEVLKMSMWGHEDGKSGCGGAVLAMPRAWGAREPQDEARLAWAATETCGPARNKLPCFCALPEQTPPMPPHLLGT